MQHLEGSGKPVLYIGRTVLKTVKLLLVYSVHRKSWGVQKQANFVDNTAGWGWALMECNEMALMGVKNVLNRGSVLYRYMRSVCVAGLRSGATAQQAKELCMHGLIHPLA